MNTQVKPYKRSFKYWAEDTFRLWRIKRLWTNLISFRIIRVHELKRLPPNSNPYNHDLMHMGMHVHKEWEMMLSTSGEQLKYVILINMKTGRRLKIILPQN